MGVKPRRYRKSCLCGKTTFFPQTEPRFCYDAPADCYRDIWVTRTRRGSSGYPGRGHDHFDRDVRSCKHCLCEVGFSSSGKPYMREHEDEIEKPKEAPPVPKDWEAIELEWFEEE